MKKAFIITSMLGLAGLAAGAIAYVLGREPIEELLAGVSTSKPKTRTGQTAAQTPAAENKQTASGGTVTEKKKVTTVKQDKTETVVASASGGKFHRPDCRYAPVDGEKLERAAALERGLVPCGVCKP